MAAEILMWVILHCTEGSDTMYLTAGISKCVRHAENAVHRQVRMIHRQ